MRLWCLLLVIALLGGRPGYAQDIAGLYQTQAIVTGTGETNRQLGFEECFRDVLVRVSGDPRVLADARVDGALAPAGSLIASFRYRDRLEGVPIHDEQGSHDRPHDLYCLFEPAKVDAFLATLGRKPWLERRPRMILFLSVRDARHQFVLTRDGQESPYMRESLLAAAAPLAIDIDVPDKVTLDSSGIAYGGTENAEAIAAGTSQAGGDIPLLGNLMWSDAERGWVADWRLSVDGHDYAWQIRGVSFDDAFRNAAAGVVQILSGHGRPD